MNARQTAQSGLAVSYRGHRAQPLSQDLTSWVLAQRRARHSWTAIARMVGVPVDSLRRAHDPDYGPIHTPSTGVCSRPTRAAVERFMRTLPGFSADDALLMGALWSASAPLSLAGLIARAGVISLASNDASARTARRFQGRAAELGVEIETSATGGSWRLSPQGRDVLGRLIQATRTDSPPTGAHP